MARAATDSDKYTFYMPNKQREAISTIVKRQGLTIAEYVRAAVAKQLVIDLALSPLEQVAEALDE